MIIMIIIAIGLSLLASACVAAGMAAAALCPWRSSAASSRVHQPTSDVDVVFSCDHLIRCDDDCSASSLLRPGAGGGFRYTPWAESLGPPLATQRVLLVGDPREAVLEVEPVTRIFLRYDILTTR